MAIFIKIDEKCRFLDEAPFSKNQPKKKAKSILESL